MTRKEEAEKAAWEYYINSDAVNPMNMQIAFGDFINGAKWADKTMIDKAYEYAEARYDLDYCGNVRDVLNYLKSLVEE